MLEELITNKNIISFSIHEYSSSIQLSDAFSITIECLIRFVGQNDEFICSNDHNQKFGLESAYDVEKNINDLIKDKNIQKVEINKNTGDIDLILDSGILQIICNSSGYESYQIRGPEDLIIVVHGGKQ